MVKSSSQSRRERAWDAWLWGARGNAVWEERARKALRDDQALRQRARTAAADVSQVESEQFVWQAGRWGQHASPSSTDGDLLKAALKSLGKCSLSGESEESDHSREAEGGSQEETVSDGGENNDAGGHGSSDESDSSGLAEDSGRERSPSSEAPAPSSSSTRDEEDQEELSSNHRTRVNYPSQGGGLSKLCRCASDCCCRSSSRKIQQRREGTTTTMTTTSGLSSRLSWPRHSFVTERPIYCSCLWNPNRGSEGLVNTRRKRQGNCSPVDRISDDVLMRVFAKLSRQEVISMSLVCRRWKEVASLEPLWRHVELVSVAEFLGDKELSLLVDKRLKHTTVLSMALCWHITATSLIALARSQCGQQLLCLDLSFCNFDDDVVNAVVENCCSLQRLRLFGGRNAVSGEALAGLANLVNLRELDLGLCFNVSQHTLKELGSKLKLLVVLSLAGCPRVTMANLLYLCGCSSLEALCLVGCKSIYMKEASEIAKELTAGGCLRLAMVEAGNHMPNAAPFPARPPPPPPFLVPAQGIALNRYGSPTLSYTHQEVERHERKDGAISAADESAQQESSENIRPKQVAHEPLGEINKGMDRTEGNFVEAFAAAIQQFQRGQAELSDGNVEAATNSFRAACHFNPSAAAYTFMAWMQRLAGADRSECVRECARAIFLDNDYGNPWNDVACELWDVGDTSLAARFFQRAKACSRYEVGAGHHPYLNLAKLHLSESVHIVHSDGQLVNKRSQNTPSKEALLELCAALIRAPGDDALQQMVFDILDGLRKCSELM